MQGDTVDILNRLRTLLPVRWFSGSGPNLDALLTCLATPWSWLYDLIQFATAQSRLATATGPWLDLIAFDFFGVGVSRPVGESDTTYRNRISWSLLREAATRSAVSRNLERLTGFVPEIFEPQNCGDTGSYSGSLPGSISSSQGMAYGIAGGWGSIDMPPSFFITVRRPVIEGISQLAGYGVGAGGFGQGLLAYVNLKQLPGSITDDDITETLVAALPVGVVAWLRIT